MTNNNTISLSSATHGLFVVHTEALTDTISWGADRDLAALHDSIFEGVGEGDYTDLDRASALIVLCYIGGGAAD